jgi:hypothetical protein
MAVLKVMKCVTTRSTGGWATEGQIGLRYQPDGPPDFAMVNMWELIIFQQYPQQIEKIWTAHLAC